MYEHRREYNIIKKALDVTYVKKWKFSLDYAIPILC
jgi:hypothetical protein